MSHAVASGFFLSAGLPVLVYALYELSRAKASQHWPTVEAKVCAAGIRQYWRRGPGMRYTPWVRYAYRFEGSSYEGKRFMFSGPLSPTTGVLQEAEEFLTPFAVGTVINVRVSPRNPRISVIEPGVDRRVWMTLLVGSMLSFMGIGGLLGWLK